MRVRTPSGRKPPSASMTVRKVHALAALPGVEAVGVTGGFPRDRSGPMTQFHVDLEAVADSALRPRTAYQPVTRGWFEALGVRLRSGRPILASDRADAPPVVVIDRTLAERWLPGREPLGALWCRRHAPRPRRRAGAPGAVALVLAAMGIFGVMAQGVAQQTREIGVRLAMGAGSGQVVGMLARQGMTLVGVGLLVGLPLAFAMYRAVAATLGGLGTVDRPLGSFATVALALASVGALSCWLPARRAAGVQPTEALRGE